MTLTENTVQMALKLLPLLLSSIHIPASGASADTGAIDEF